MALESIQKSIQVYINNEPCIARKVEITDMVLPYGFTNPCAVIYEDELHVIGGGYHYKWNGSQWVSVSTPTTGNGCAVVYDGEIHFFIGNAHYGWNGTEWTTYTLPSGVSVVDCVLFGNDLHIFGGTAHYKWDGTEWTSVSTLPVTFDKGRVVVYDEMLTLLGSGHYEWDGTAWSSASTLPATFNDVVVLDDLYLIGCGTDSDQSYVWDGTDWTLDEELEIPLINGKTVVYNGAIFCIGGLGYTKMCIKYGSDIISGSITMTQ